MNPTVNEIRQEIDSFSAFLPSIGDMRLASFHKEFHERLNHIDALSKSRMDDRPNLMKYLLQKCAPEFERSIPQKQSVRKPLGYTGDYLINDWMLVKKIGSEGRGLLWDCFFHHQDCVRAARSRGDVLTTIIDQCIDAVGGSIHVLDLACGSCRDFTLMLDRIGEKARGSRFHCVDFEQRALDLAMTLTRDSNSYICWEFELANAFKIRPTTTYNLIYSSGLFGYLNDRLAVRLIKRMWGWTTSGGGRMVFCNMHPRNPSRNYMEWCGEWFVIHRTEEDLLRLCEMAGVPQKCVKFMQEFAGVFTFCAAIKE